MMSKPQKPAAQSDEAAPVLSELQVAQLMGKPTVPLPNDGRVVASDYIGMRYPGMDATQMLGNPESILKSPRPGCKYIWRRRLDRTTVAWIRSGVIRPVSPDELEADHPDAEYIERSDEAGDFVLWGDLALFEMAPKWNQKIYEAPADYAIARVAQGREEFLANIAQATGGNYRGTMTVKKANT